MTLFFGQADLSSLPPLQPHGVGTAGDPITFISDQAVFPKGTVIWVPTVQKYFVMEGDCPICDTNWQSNQIKTVDLWSGDPGSSGKYSQQNCNTVLKQILAKGSPVPIKVSPPSSEPVNLRPIFNPTNHECFNGLVYDDVPNNLTPHRPTPIPAGGGNGGGSQGNGGQGSGSNPPVPGNFPTPNIAPGEGGSEGASSTNLVIVDHSGQSGPIYLYLVGNGGQTVQSYQPTVGGTSTYPLPPMRSARIYFSFGQPLDFSGGKQPGFGSDTPQTYDWAEFDYENGMMYINTTQVDMFSIPYTITMLNNQVGVPDGLRSKIFAAFAADPDLKTLMFPANNPIRLLNPYFGITTTATFPSAYLDSYINQVWDYYSSHTLTMNVANQTWSGTASGASFTMSGGGQSVTFTKPTTEEVFGCAIPATGAASAPVVPAFCAGFNRGTLLTGAAQPDQNPADVYKVTPTNTFSKVIHAYSIGGLAYGFPYDDSGPFSSVIAANRPSQVTITFSKW